MLIALFYPNIKVAILQLKGNFEDNFQTTTTFELIDRFSSNSFLFDSLFNGPFGTYAHNSMGHFKKLCANPAGCRGKLNPDAHTVKNDMYQLE